MEIFFEPAHAIELLDLYGPSKVADFGAGAGYFTIPIAQKLGPGSIVYALDVQEAPLDIVRREAKTHKLTNIRTIRRDLEKPGGSSLADEHADHVVIANMLTQTAHPAEVLAEAFRILRKNGTLLVVESHKPFGIRDTVTPKAEVKQNLFRIGFVLAREKDLGEYHYALVSKK